MSKVINIIGSSSNVGKTFLIEGLIKELTKRNLKVATIKHDIHGFDIDKEGKDTYKHRKAGAQTVIISSKNRLAMINELEEEKKLDDIINMIDNKDIILVEGYKKSNLRKIEVFRDGISKEIISPKEKLIAIASDIDISFEEIPVIHKEDYKLLADLIEKEKDYIKE
ncbi:molybdopterin-guanine dinucleotide biosynthesis protein B [Clostridium sp. CCUG 7971]|uniref:molybdopterin-guanine dinucleotide biosynthesis protein B n=1 Tax=Clostridium sp. CCUG 7971 TaxID=2811414 RepID=UPI001ABA3B8C|nr:molybdopterin-guanine dinucleotide biosynthesis protein B [Clostridium sp. CCUG 7971]MBO3444748.1 molybdopterin-guanine dinucleotide biosynthesis protein B [Clostridium sp. CCUG 7971]